VGDTFTAAVQNDIAKQINEMHAFITVANPNATSTGAGGPTTWVTVGNVTVPAWASKARLDGVLEAISGSATNAQADLTVKIGTSTSTVGTHRCAAPGVTTRFDKPIFDLLTSVPTGSQSMIVQATFVSGTFSAPNSVCSFSFNIDWLA
jgi:hypothetical protein